MLRNLSRQTKKTNMSVEETEKSIEKKPALAIKLQQQGQQQGQKPQQKNLSQVVHYTNSQRFHDLVGEVYSDTDSTLLYAIPNPVDAFYPKRHIVFRNIVYIISNWTHDKFPNVIYINLRDWVGGYKRVTYSQQTNEYSVQVTGRIAALQLDSVTATMDESSVRTYELRYALRDSVTWDVSNHVAAQFKFEVLIDDSPEAQMMPLPSMMDLNVELRKSP